MEVNKIKALFFIQSNLHELRRISLPTLRDNEVRILVKACGLCGTDVHMYEGNIPVSLPITPGHEFSGIVDKVGSQVERLRPGMKVVVNPTVVCDNCLSCRQGRQHLCTNLRSIGVQLPGGFAEYVQVSQNQVYELPLDFDLEWGVFVEPLSCCIHGLDLCNIRIADFVVIIGAGPVGLLMLQLCLLSGAVSVAVVEVSPNRGLLAQKLGADVVINPRNEEVAQSIWDFFKAKPDVAIECVGSKETIGQSLELCRRGGRVLLFGVVDPKVKILVSPYEVYRNETTIGGSFINPYTFHRAIGLLNSNKLKIAGLITHKYSLSEFEKALATYRNDPSRIKIILEPSRGRE